LTGAQLLSDVLGDTGPALFNRLGAAWKSALITIVPDDLLPRLLAFVDETAARYGRSATIELEPAPDQVA